VPRVRQQATTIHGLEGAYSHKFVVHTCSACLCTKCVYTPKSFNLTTRMFYRNGSSGRAHGEHDAHLTVDLVTFFPSFSTKAVCPMVESNSSRLTAQYIDAVFLPSSCTQQVGKLEASYRLHFFFYSQIWHLEATKQQNWLGKHFIFGIF
jgi:hypothetical protein